MNQYIPFPELVKKACGNRTMSEFGAASNIAVSSIYRYASGEIKKPVSRDIAERLAAASADKNISADMLIQSSAQFLASDSEPVGLRMREEMEEAIKNAQRIMLQHLIQSGYIIKELHPHEPLNFKNDFTLIVQKDGAEEIHFYDVLIYKPITKKRNHVYEWLGHTLSSINAENERFNLIIFSDDFDLNFPYEVQKRKYPLPISIFVIKDDNIVQHIDLLS